MRLQVYSQQYHCQIGIIEVNRNAAFSDEELDMLNNELSKLGLSVNPVGNYPLYKSPDGVFFITETAKNLYRRALPALETQNGNNEEESCPMSKVS